MTDATTGHPGPDRAPGAQPGRRELNKARTREAITEALRELLQEQPAHKITVDQLAETAGVSRRTFFNYYAGIPAVISEVIGTHTESLVDALDEIAPTSAFAQLRELVSAIGIPTEFMEWMAALDLHAGLDDPATAALERMVWAEKGAWLESVLLERLPADIDPLYVSTLASTIMNCFAAAERSWSAGRDASAPVDEAAMAAFYSQLDRALAYAESGWATSAGNVAGD